MAKKSKRKAADKIHKKAVRAKKTEIPAALPESSMVETKAEDIPEVPESTITSVSQLTHEDLKLLGYSHGSKLFILLNIFLVIGILSASFLLFEHFVPAASKFCTFGQSIDCGIVNKSPYATLDGISYLLTIDFKLPL